MYYDRCGYYGRGYRSGATYSALYAGIYPYGGVYPYSGGIYPYGGVYGGMYPYGGLGYYGIY